MRVIIEKRTCNRCGTVETKQESNVATDAFAGWLFIDAVETFPTLPRADGGPWDLCSYECAIHFLAKKAGVTS